MKILFAAKAAGTFAELTVRPQMAGIHQRWIRTSLARRWVGVPKPLFQTRVSAGVDPLRMHYVPARDGQRFLVNTQTGDPAPNPITVVLNWTAGLKK